MTAYARPEITLPAPYRLGAPLPEGLNGPLYRARDEVGGGEVLIKCFEQARRGAYLREMAAALGLDHPGLARCLDTFYLPDGRGCLVYEYLPGGALRPRLAGERALPTGLALKCLRDLLEALDYLHRLGLIHCDIKPENVLLRQPDTDHPDFVLSDLGAASFLREAREGRHTTGSPAYAAPERLHEGFSPVSDLYSLGVLGFEILTGHRPFRGTPMAVYRAHAAQPPPVGEIREPLLQDFIEQLLQKDPARRPASARAALAMLEGIGRGRLAGETTASAPLLVGPATPRRKLTATASLHCLGMFPVAGAPTAVLATARHGTPLAGLVYPQHIEFRALDGTSDLPLLPNVGPVQVAGPGRLAYTTGSRLMLLDLDAGSRRCLRDNCAGLLAFHWSGRRLLWCGPAGGRLVDLLDQSERAYASRSFFLNPQLHLLPDGGFLTSAGPVNQFAVLHDAATAEIHRWTLNGPIMGFTQRASAMFAVSLDTEGDQSCTFWRLSRDEAPRSRRLPAPPGSWWLGAGEVYWIDPRGYLYRVDGELVMQRLGVWGNNIQRFHISADQRFLVALTPAPSGAEVSVWENRA